MTMLDIRGVTKKFGSLVAVDDVSMQVAAGELRAIIGPNGAGKTTFFNMISGFFAPTAGEIVFDGETVTKWRSPTGSPWGWRARSRSPRFFRN